MQNLLTQPDPRSKGHWVQTERKAHEAWADLIRKSPLAAQVMHVLTARVGESNAVVISQKNLARLVKASERGVRNALQLLCEDNWIEIRQIGGRGTVNAHIINDRVAWSGKRDGIRYSLFSASVIVSDDEQPDGDEIGKQSPLRRLPMIGENQLPAGPGLPPPSQPFLDNLEPELPATANHDPTGIPHEVAQAIRWWHRLPVDKMKEWCDLVGDTVEVPDDEGYPQERPRPTIEIAVDAYRMNAEIRTYFQEDEAP